MPLAVTCAISRSTARATSAGGVGAVPICGLLALYDDVGVDLVPLEAGGYVVPELNGAAEFDERYSLSSRVFEASRAHRSPEERFCHVVPMRRHGLQRARRVGEWNIDDFVAP